MAKQERTYVKPGRTTASRDMQEKIHEDTKTRSAAKADAIKAEMDEMLDEIDNLLENNEEFVNAEAFVDSFRQKGGE